MDEARTIRYVTPPAFFYGSLMLGAWFHTPSRIEHLAKHDFYHLAAVVGASLFPLGFLIAGASSLVLEGLFVRSKQSYEAYLESEAWNRIWTALRFCVRADDTPLNRRNAAQTFDHELLPAHTHAGAVRLWSAFNVATRSCMAIILALPIGYCLLDIELSAQWLWSSLIVGLLLCWIALTTWRRHMAFIELQTRRSFNVGKREGQN